jgi:hypothetical protein
MGILFSNFSTTQAYSYMPLLRHYTLLIAGIILVFYNSSKTSAPEADNLLAETKPYLVTLPDSLGSIELRIPNRYDTFFKWTHYSDCTGCGWKKYRFQSKKMPIFEESGWLWNALTDSVDRLTIAHSDYTEKTGWRLSYIDTAPQNSIKIRHKMLLEMAKTSAEMSNITSDTIEQINGAWYSVIASKKYDFATKIFGRFVVGTSRIRDNEITFKFQLLTKVNDSTSNSFIKKSLRLLRSIKLHNGI